MKRQEEKGRMNTKNEEEMFDEQERGNRRRKGSVSHVGWDFLPGDLAKDGVLNGNGGLLANLSHGE